MKHLRKLICALFLSILLGIPAAFAVFYYTQPMEDVSYNLSLIAEDAQEWEGEKGWTVYTNDEGRESALVSNGYGGYTGLAYAGQTLYYSRTLEEKLDNPMVQISTANRTVAVFLDDEVLYTDCPELDNRIGYLTLPMLEYDRMDAVTISLPPDYQGKTLTIAQSSPLASEKATGDQMVFPCDVTLYCGYAYESGLIASSARTMLPAALLFALVLFLIGFFIWNAGNGSLIIHLPLFILAILLHMCNILARADFFYPYFGMLPIDPSWLCFHLSVGTLLFYLTLRAGRYCLPFAAATAIHWLSVLLHVFTLMGMLLEYGDLYLALVELPQITGFFALIFALAGAFHLWRRTSAFFRHLSQAALILTVGYLLFLAVSIPLSHGYAASVFSRIQGEILLRLPNFSLQLVWKLCLFSTLYAAFLELLEHEAGRRTEQAVLAAKSRLAIESYANLFRQSEEMQILRHDTVRHYSTLRAMAKESPERLSGYLDELIGQAEAIRPVVSSGNAMLDILLNGKLSLAANKNISVELVRSNAPKNLPLTDTELCCLIINILDNAIDAAAGTVSGGAYLKLDFHCKDCHFVFSCENSTPGKYSGKRDALHSRRGQSVPAIKTPVEGYQNSPDKSKKIPTSGHGYGLKIIRQIMNRFGDNMLSIEQSDNTYKITVVIPLPAPAGSGKCNG